MQSITDAEIIARTAVVPAGTRSLRCLRRDGVRGIVHLCADGSFWRRYVDGEEHYLGADGLRHRTLGGQAVVCGGALSSCSRHILFVNWHTAFMRTWEYDAPLRMWLPIYPAPFPLCARDSDWARWALRGVHRRGLRAPGQRGRTGQWKVVRYRPRKVQL